MSVALTGPLPPSATGHRCTVPQPAGTLSLAGRWRARAPRLSTFTYSYFPAGLAPGTATGTGHLSSSRACKSHGDQPGDRSPLTESSHSPGHSYRNTAGTGAAPTPTSIPREIMGSVLALFRARAPRGTGRHGCYIYMYVGPWRHVPAAYVRARARARAVVNESMNWWLAISTSPSVCFKKKKKDLSVRCGGAWAVRTDARSKLA